MRFLLRAYGCFYRQAEYPVVLNPEKVNNKYKEFVVSYMPDCSTEEHLHKKIQEFQCYKNSTITTSKSICFNVFSIHRLSGKFLKICFFKFFQGYSINIFQFVQGNTSFSHHKKNTWLRT